MKKGIIAAACIALLGCCLLGGCSKEEPEAVQQETTPPQEEVLALESEGTEEEESAAAKAEEPESGEAVLALEDGVYLAKFETDSGMFHVNEACEGKGTLTVKDGEMTIHISLASKNILNLFQGLADEAEKEGASILEPTTDEITYSDGMTDEVYGFDVPVPALDTEFDLALLGKKGTWYDHKVIVSEPERLE